MSYFSQISQRSGNLVANGVIHPQGGKNRDVADLHDPFQEITELTKETGDTSLSPPATKEIPVAKADKTPTTPTSDQGKETSIEPTDTAPVFQSIHPVELSERIEKTERIVEIQPSQDKPTSQGQQKPEVPDTAKRPAAKQADLPIIIRGKEQENQSIGPPPIVPSDFRSLEESKEKPEKEVKPVPEQKPVVVDTLQPRVAKDRTPSQQKTLLPQAPAPQKKVSRKPEPKLAIGKITVELKTPPPAVEQQQQTPTPTKRSRRRASSQSSKLKYNSRFGLGQL